MRRLAATLLHHLERWACRDVEADLGPSGRLAAF
jgi:hypothetical protein